MQLLLSNMQPGTARSSAGAHTPIRTAVRCLWHHAHVRRSSSCRCSSNDDEARYAVPVDRRSLCCCSPTSTQRGGVRPSASAHTPTRTALLCLCGVMRTYSGAACAAAPQRQQNLVHSARRQELLPLRCAAYITGAACAAAPQRQHRLAR